MIESDGRQRENAQKEYTNEFGVKTVCVISGVKQVEIFLENTNLPGRGPRLFFGDSWFDSMKPKAVCKLHKLGRYVCY